MNTEEQQDWKDFAEYRVQLWAAVLEYFSLPRLPAIPSDCQEM